VIPYSEMTFHDFDFYWGTSVLFHIIEDSWVAVTPDTRMEDEDGEMCLIYSECDTLESLDCRDCMIPFMRYFGGSPLMVPPLAPFRSPDWVTYEPKLGYFVLNDSLVLLTSSTPRSRHKGLHTRRLKSMPVIDAGATSNAVARVMTPRSAAMLPFSSLVQEIAHRLNNEFSSSWYLSVLNSLVAKEARPIVLNHNTAFVPEQGETYGYLLTNGAMLGRIEIQGTRLVFTPRCKPTSTIEATVTSVIRAKLTTVPQVTANNVRT